jgi:hypothetical protein
MAMRKSNLFYALTLCTMLGGCGAASSAAEMDASAVSSENQSTTAQATETAKTDTTESDAAVADTAANSNTQTAGQPLSESSFEADLTHDGTPETISFQADNEDEPTVITLSVKTSDGNTLFTDELMCNWALGSRCYLVEVDGQSYLMDYFPLYDHETLSASYQIYSLSGNGDQQELDADSIETGFYEDTPEFDKDAWISFADKVNAYLDNGFLLVSTTEDNLRYSTADNSITETENYGWIDSYDKDIEGNLQTFQKDYEKYRTQND